MGNSLPWLRWLITVLIEYKSPPANSFEKCLSSLKNVGHLSKCLSFNFSNYSSHYM